MQFHQSLFLLSILGLVSVQSVDGCADDATFKFPLNYDSSKMENCAWLTKNVKKTTYRTTTYCPSVKAKCVKSCTTCSTSSPIILYPVLPHRRQAISQAQSHPNHPHLPWHLLELHQASPAWPPAMGPAELPASVQVPSHPG